MPAPVPGPVPARGRLPAGAGRDELLERTQGRNAVPYDRSIDVQISRLRTRLRDNGREPQLIKTVRGDGYVLATDVRPQFVRPALPVDAPIMPGK